MKKKSTVTVSRSKTDAVSMLKQDHKKVKRLLNEFEDAESDQRVELLNQIEFEIKVHMKIEEEIFYPAFKEAVRSEDDKQKFFEALEEHHITSVVMREIESADPESEQFEAKGKVLKDLIEHHVEEEEGEMFPKAKKAIGAAELRRLGEAMKSRKETLMSSAKTGKKVA
jgi:hemerythrin superfamily protein